MRRSLLIVFTVAALSAWISHVQQAPVAAAPTDWVRTVDGWQRRGVLELQTATPHEVVHPGLVAAFQLGASAMALLAFPARAAVVRARA